MSSSSTGSSTTTTITKTIEGHYWEPNRKSSALWPVAVGALGLLGLGLIHGIPVRHSIEDHIRSETTAKLSALGLPSTVGVDVTGRDVTLTNVPAGTDLTTLVNTVQGLEGVRVATASGGGSTAVTPSPSASPSVEASASVAPSPSDTASPSPSDTASPSPSAAAATPPTVSAAIKAGKIVLTGKVPSKDFADKLAADATAVFGAGNVDNQLTVDDTVGSDGLAALSTVIAALGKDSAATVALSGGAITLTGAVPSDDAKKAADAAAATVTGDVGKVTDQLTVASAPTSAPQSQLAALPQITFQTASASLTSAGYAAVKQAAAILKANPAVKVRIEGNTDDIGDSEINRELSVARAANVRTALRYLGIADDRMSYVGYGESRPKVANTSDAARAINRRVEFVVL